MKLNFRTNLFSQENAESLTVIDKKHYDNTIMRSEIGLIFYIYNVSANFS